MKSLATEDHIKGLSSLAMVLSGAIDICAPGPETMDSIAPGEVRKDAFAPDIFEVPSQPR